MRKTATLITALITVFLVSSLYAQSPYREQTEPSARESMLQTSTMQTGFSGILDPSRISMSQQFGMSYGSAGGQGYTQGYYMNTISYRFNAPVLLNLRLGATNNPFSSSVAQPGQSAMSSLLSNAEFIGGADLIWQPSDKLTFLLSVDRMPSSLYASPYGYNDNWNSYSPYSSFLRRMGGTSIINP